MVAKGESCSRTRFPDVEETDFRGLYAAIHPSTFSTYQGNIPHDSLVVGLISRISRYSRV